VLNGELSSEKDRKKEWMKVQENEQSSSCDELAKVGSGVAKVRKQVELPDLLTLCRPKLKLPCLKPMTRGRRNIESGG
jgi:hypothetical protein